eukprot:COSAG02_NODE_13970_length_1325_cov_1.560359_1_plen_64_part_10
MVSRGEYEVERVEHELKWITPSGAMKRAFLFEWVVTCSDSVPVFDAGSAGCTGAAARGCRSFPT